MSVFDTNESRPIKFFNSLTFPDHFFFLISSTAPLVSDLVSLLLFEKSFKKCVSNNCDFFLTTELFLTGYPPQDLILRNDFLNKVQLYKKKIKALTKNKSSILLLNIPEKTNNKIFNTIFLFKNV